MSDNPPFAWLRKVDQALLQLDQIPLFGYAPQFDVDLIASMMASHLNTPSLKIETSDCGWRTEKKILAGLGSNIFSLGISVSPLAGNAIWMIGREDIARITGLMMNGKTRSKALSSEILQEGFYRYLILEALDSLQSLEPLKEFSLKMNEEPESSLEKAYCIDVKISIDQHAFWGRLVLDPQFMTAWQRHFASLRELFSLTPLAQTLEVPVSICTGTCRLTLQEWKKLNAGDFILLDHGGYDPRHHEGVASLQIGATALFQVSVKENKIKLIDYAHIKEEFMEKTPDISNAEIAPEAMTQEERSIAIKELPLVVTVELARLRMSVDQLMKLSPGNFLELPVHPDQDVSLTVNGQKIGRAELVHLGDALGIRIIETA